MRWNLRVTALNQTAQIYKFSVSNQLEKREKKGEDT